MLPSHSLILNPFNPSEMRKELFYNPGLLTERIGEGLATRRRMRQLRGTPAAGLNRDQLSTLEFVQLAAATGKIRTAYDLGANMGSWTLLAKTFLPGLTVHAFEPVPAYQQEFINSVKRITGVTLHKVGAGAENKQATFNLSGHSSSFLEVSDNLLKSYPSEKKTGDITVNMIRLDDYVREHQLPLPDLMKLDVEGYEVEALSAATECMKNCRYIILEVSFIERHIGQALFHEVAHFMASRNFMVHAFPHGMHLAQPIQSVDILFKNTLLD